MFKSSEITKRQYKTGEVAEFLNISVRYVIMQDKDGKLPFKRTEGGRRFMFREDLIEVLKDRGLLINDDEEIKKHDIIYARVSSHEQKAKGDLDRQVVKVLEFATNKGLQNPIILKEVGSGLNDNRKQIQKLISMVMKDEVNRIFISYKERLTRFGFHYLETVCQAKGIEILVVSDEENDKSAQDEMVEDMMALLASFSGKLYGMRGKTKAKAVQTIEKIPEMNE